MNIYLSNFHRLDEEVLSDGRQSLKRFYIFCLPDRFSSESTRGLVFSTPTPRLFFNDSITIHGYSWPKGDLFPCHDIYLLMGPWQKLGSSLSASGLCYTLMQGFYSNTKNQPHVEREELHPLTKNQSSKMNEKAKHKLLAWIYHVEHISHTFAVNRASLHIYQREFPAGTRLRRRSCICF